MGAEGSFYTSLLQATAVFKGERSDDAVEWILQLERIALALNCPPEIKLAVALARLKENSYRWSATQQFPTWEQFRMAFLGRYADDEEVVRSQFHSARQGASEKVADFIDRFRLLAARAQTVDRSELMRRFVNGLRLELYSWVLGSRPADFDEAARQALYFERELEIRRKVEERQRTAEQPAPQPRREAWNPQWNRSRAPPRPHWQQQDMMEVDEGFGPSQELKRARINHRESNRVCWNCGHPGHVAAFCRAPPSRDPRPSAPPNMFMFAIQEPMFSDADTDTECSERNLSIAEGHPLKPSFLTMPLQEEENDEWADFYHSTNLDLNAKLPKTFFTRPATPYPSGRYSSDEGEPKRPERALHMRQGLEELEHSPEWIMERMEIDKLEHMPKPHKRRAFGEGPQPPAHTWAPPNSSNPTRPTFAPRGNPPAPPTMPPGPRIIRQPAGAPNPQLAKPAPRADEVLVGGLNQHEAKLLRELYEGIRVRNMDVDAMRATNFERVLGTLARKLTQPPQSTQATHATPPASQPTTQINAAVVPDRPPETTDAYDVLTATVNIAGQDCKAILDTGASSSAVSRVLCMRLNLLDYIEDVRIPYVNADGVTCWATGKISNLPIKLGSLSLRADMLVTPATNYDCLVGVDVLGAARVSVNFQERYLEYSIDGQTRGRVPISYTSTRRRPREMNTFSLVAAEMRSAGQCSKAQEAAQEEEDSTRRGECAAPTLGAEHQLSTDSEDREIALCLKLQREAADRFAIWQSEPNSPLNGDNGDCRDLINTRSRGHRSTHWDTDGCPHEPTILPLLTCMQSTIPPHQGGGSTKFRPPRSTTSLPRRYARGLIPFARR